MVNLYRKGRIAEKKVVNILKQKGFENIRRSSGSRGFADVYAKRGNNKYYFQVKSGSARASREEIRGLRNLARKRHGVAVVIEKRKRKFKWKFFGRW